MDSIKRVARETLNAVWPQGRLGSPGDPGDPGNPGDPGELWAPSWGAPLFLLLVLSMAAVNYLLLPLS